MTTQNTTTVEIRDIAYGTTSGFEWGWPDEAQLAAFAEPDIRAKMTDRLEQAEPPVDIDFEYATLYFGS